MASKQVHHPTNALKKGAGQQLPHPLQSQLKEIQNILDAIENDNRFDSNKILRFLKNYKIIDRFYKRQAFEIKICRKVSLILKRFWRSLESSIHTKYEFCNKVNSIQIKHTRKMFFTVIQILFSCFLCTETWSWI